MDLGGEVHIAPAKTHRRMATLATLLTPRSEPVYTLTRICAKLE